MPISPSPACFRHLALPGGPGLTDAPAGPQAPGSKIASSAPILPACSRRLRQFDWIRYRTPRRSPHPASARSPDLPGAQPHRQFRQPPVLAASPASELAHHVGQALMVVRADQTGEAALRDAISILSGCEDIKLLLNCTRLSPTGRRFGSYYGTRNYHVPDISTSDPGGRAALALLGAEAQAQSTPYGDPATAMRPRWAMAAARPALPGAADIASARPAAARAPRSGLTSNSTRACLPGLNRSMKC